MEYTPAPAPAPGAPGVAGAAGNATATPHLNVLDFYVGGPKALELEGLSLAEAVAQATEVLQRLFGGKGGGDGGGAEGAAAGERRDEGAGEGGKLPRLRLVEAVPAPRRAYKTDWLANRWSRGAWAVSYEMGSSCIDYSRLAEPMADGAIGFAGEATCAKMPGNTHRCRRFGSSLALRFAH